MRVPRRTAAAPPAVVAGDRRLRGARCRLSAGRRRDLSADRRAGRSHSRPGVELVKARTGRDLVVAGPTSLTYFPRFGVAFSEVSLAAPADMGGPPVLAARRLQVELPVWSLLSKRVAARRVLLDGAGGRAARRCAGRRSWDFAAWLDRPTRLAQAGGRANDAAPRHAAARAASRSLLPASNVRIVDATVRYVDERSGTSQEVSRARYGSGRRRCRQCARCQRRPGLDGREDRLRRRSLRRSRPTGPGSLSAARRRPTVRGHLRRQRRAWPGAWRPMAPSASRPHPGPSWCGGSASSASATPETGALAVSTRVAAANRRIAADATCPRRWATARWRAL